MQIFRLPPLSVPGQSLFRPAPVGQVQRLPSSIFSGSHSERHTADLDDAVVEANFTWFQALQGCPDRELSRPDGGTCRKPNTRRNLVLVEEGEPILTDEFAVCKQTADTFDRADKQEAFQQGIVDYL